MKLIYWLFENKIEFVGILFCEDNSLISEYFSSYSSMLCKAIVKEIE